MLIVTRTNPTPAETRVNPPFEELTDFLGITVDKVAELFAARDRNAAHPTVTAKTPKGDFVLVFGDEELFLYADAPIGDPPAAVKRALLAVFFERERKERRYSALAPKTSALKPANPLNVGFRLFPAGIEARVRQWLDEDTLLWESGARRRLWVDQSDLMPVPEAIWREVLKRLIGFDPGHVPVVFDFEKGSACC